MLPGLLVERDLLRRLAGFPVVADQLFRRLDPNAVARHVQAERGGGRFHHVLGDFFEQGETKVVGVGAVLDGFHAGGHEELLGDGGFVGNLAFVD